MATCDYGFEHPGVEQPVFGTLSCYDFTHSRTYRGRDKMNMLEFIEDVEKSHFRTGHDTGANHNALFIWNLVRNHAGLPSLTQDDLIQRHADDKGWTLEEMKEDYRRMEEFRRSRKVGY